MTVKNNQLFDPVIISDSTETELFIVPSNYVADNVSILFTNSTASIAKVDMWAVPPSGSPSQTNNFCVELQVADKDSEIVQVPKVGAGYSIKAKADTATSIAAFPLSGYLVSVKE